MNTNCCEQKRGGKIEGRGKTGGVCSEGWFDFLGLKKRGSSVDPPPELEIEGRRKLKRTRESQRGKQGSGRRKKKQIRWTPKSVEKKEEILKCLRAEH